MLIKMKPSWYYALSKKNSNINPFMTSKLKAADYLWETPGVLVP